MKVESIEQFQQEKNRLFATSLAMERIADVTVGRLVIPVRTFHRWMPSEAVLLFINTLNRNDAYSERARRSLTFSLNHNSPNPSKIFGHERAVSSYFTYNPENETLIIEWGTIDLTSGVAKLHDYLNKVIDLNERKRLGMKISSGHIAKSNKGVYLALLDSVIGGVKEDIRSPIGKIINSLYQSNFVPISADGFVKLPAF